MRFPMADNALRVLHWNALALRYRLRRALKPWMFHALPLRCLLKTFQSDRARHIVGVHRLFGLHVIQQVAYVSLH